MFVPTLSILASEALRTYVLDTKDEYSLCQKREKAEYVCEALAHISKASSDLSSFKEQRELLYAALVDLLKEGGTNWKKLLDSGLSMETVFELHKASMKRLRKDRGEIIDELHNRIHDDLSELIGDDDKDDGDDDKDDSSELRHSLQQTQLRYGDGNRECFHEHSQKTARATYIQGIESSDDESNTEISDDPDDDETMITEDKSEDETAINERST